jgi:K+-sensing histidine kinase KdpD
MIVHDLRSPLTTVTGYVDALEQMASDKLNPDEAKCVAEAKRGAVDMRDMITTLLDLSRLEAGGMRCAARSQPAEIAREAANRFTPVLRGRTLRCEVPPEPVSILRRRCHPPDSREPHQQCVDSQISRDDPGAGS